MVQTILPGSPQTPKRRKRPKNREVENEMMGWVDCPGEPPHSATEPAPEDNDPQDDNAR